MKICVHVCEKSAFRHKCSFVAYMNVICDMHSNEIIK